MQHWGWRDKQSIFSVTTPTKREGGEDWINKKGERSGESPYNWVAKPTEREEEQGVIEYIQLVKL